MCNDCIWTFGSDALNFSKRKKSTKKGKHAFFKINVISQRSRSNKNKDKPILSKNIKLVNFTYPVPRCRVDQQTRETMVEYSV